MANVLILDEDGHVIGSGRGETADDAVANFLQSPEGADYCIPEGVHPIAIEKGTTHILVPSDGVLLQITKEEGKGN
jgi:hypothetical protein